MFRLNLKVGILFVLANVFCISSCYPEGLLNTIGGSVDQSQCGGPLEADTDFLVHPRPGQTVEPGEMCVWTLHMPTTHAFKLSLPTLNINSSSECEDGAIRIYSLTNLVNTENLQSYTFCDAKPPPETFYLIENVVAVVFYAGSNPSSFTGFTLTWAGIAFSPIPTTHVTSYSSSSSGLIKFPVEGEYEPSTIATWLVKAADIQEQLNVTLTLTSLNVETCANVDDPCVCDALILYEITNDGILSESDRFCGERPSEVKESISANFIVAFYSDFKNVDGSGTGFDLVYTPILAQRPSTPCGSMIYVNVQGDESVEGEIFFKPDEFYSANERCTWTIRSNRKTMDFRLDEAGFETLGDRVLVDFFAYYGQSGNENGDRSDPYSSTALLTSEEIGITKSSVGSVAIVSFVSGESTRGKGFVLWYRCSGLSEVVDTDSYSTDVVDATADGVIAMQGIDRNYLMSSMVLPPVNYQLNPQSQKKFHLVMNAIEQCSNSCCDSLRLYALTNNGLVLVDQFCGTGERDFACEDTFVVILKTDRSDASNGFSISWNLETIPGISVTQIM